MPSPLFISFEGGEGAGKSTQAKILHDSLGAAGIHVALVHEPGTTPLGSYLRDYLKSKQPLSKEAELLLFEAARAELVVEKIRPGLDQGLVVIADRFEASTIAYQGYGRNIDLKVIHYLNSFATSGRLPDLPFLLDLEPADGLRRKGNPQLALPLELGQASAAGPQDIEGHRRFEDESLQFHARIRRGFLTLARADPARWVIIDATLPAGEVSRLVWDQVAKRLKL